MSNVDFRTFSSDASPIAVRQEAPARRRGAIVLPSRLTVSVHVSMKALEADWRVLEALQPSSLHQGFDWCKTWAKTHRHRLLLVRGRIGERTVFILPLELVRGRLFRTARFIGSPHSNINTGLFASDFSGMSRDRLAAALIAELSVKLAHVADIVTLEKMPFDWGGQSHPLASLPSVRNQNASYQLPLLDTFADTLAQINAKRRRKKFRVSEKRLEALGGYDYVVAGSREESRDLLERFFEQKAVRFEALGLPNVFRDTETQNFFHMLAAVDRDPSNRPLELHAIRLKGPGTGRIAAIAGLSRKDDHMICQFGSIDETLAADTSPGELLFYRIIENACASGVRLFDFGIGDQPYKRSWCTVETPQRDIVLPLTLRGRIAAGVHRLIVHAKCAIKSHHGLYSAVQRFRQKHQSGPAAEPAQAPETD